MSYNYNSWEPIKVKPEDLTDREIKLLRDSKTFCIYPWIHMHTYPTGETWPCCGANMEAGPCGSTKEFTLKELWNSNRMKELRLHALQETQNNWCTRCYEQDNAGFFSMRKSANKHHGHHIKRILNTNPDGSLKDFQMTYWDIRFSNLCNLSCRSCGHIFSSSWFKDQVALAPGYEKTHKALNVAGRYETDMLEQVLEHLPYVEQIYFAGGEPLTMEEHYIILDKLVELKKFNVRLIYNTNFTQVEFKGKSVFDYWKLFDSVSVGASLDGMDNYAEYIRKGTKWSIVEQNRDNMQSICPDVDFYISCTLSILNAKHVVDFHKDWTEHNFIHPQDFNINILQDPSVYSITIAPEHYKKEIQELYNEHLEWLKPLDKLNRASTGFQAALNYMNAKDDSNLISAFLERTKTLDKLRNESIYNSIPELKALQV